jgi:hypothetical protein
MRGHLTIKSEQGDYIGQGHRASYVTGTHRRVTTTMQVTKYGSEGLNVTLDEGTAHHWTLLLVPQTGQKLQRGDYLHAERFATADHAGLDFFGDGRGCNQSYSEVWVRRIDRAADGSVARLDVWFMQHCESASAPMLSGRVQYRAAG